MSGMSGNKAAAVSQATTKGDTPARDCGLPEPLFPRNAFTTSSLPIAAVVLIIIGLILQWQGNAFTSNFGTEEPDEPAHYVTGLMIRDYVGDDLGGAPMAFAKNYYLHYPKVALGAWPPFYYIVEGAWMLIFSTSRTSVLALSLLISVLSALTVLLIAKRLLGTILAFMAATVYMMLPLVQSSSSSVMMDGLVALLELLAALELARYLNVKRAWDAYLFGIITGLAALTKVNAIALLLLPGIVMVLTRSLHLLRRKEIWIGFAFVVAVAAPWNLFLLRLAAGSVNLLQFDAGSFLSRGILYLRLLAESVWVFLPLAALGWYAAFWAPWRQGTLSTLWASMFGLIAAGFVFHMLVPVRVIEPRYLLPCVAPVLLFAAAGVRWLAERVEVPRWGLSYRTLAAAVILCLFFFALQFKIPRRQEPRFTQTAQRLARQPVSRTILVSGPVEAEGMAVSEIAMQDRRPRHFVLRALKVLAQSDWNGDGYHSRFQNPKDMSKYLDSVPIDYVLTANGDVNNKFLHHRLLLQALESHPEIWARDPAAQGPFAVWNRIHPLNHGQPRFSDDMRYTFRGSLSSEGNSR